jgi:very-short-patch-repair endonuclease
LEGWGFRRQADVAVYVVDFLCHDPRLVIEVDAPVHDPLEQPAFDRVREQRFGAAGFAVLRVDERLVREAPEYALLLIKAVGTRVLEGLPFDPEEMD